MMLNILAIYTDEMSFRYLKNLYFYRSMQKPWFPQQNSADAPTALLKNFICQIQFPVSRPTIEKDVKEYPGFPFLSFGDLSKILERWGLKSVVYNCEMQDLKEIPTPSVLFINEEADGVKQGNFILFTGITDGMIEYLHTRKGWVLEDPDAFEKKWAKAALSLTEATSEGESDFENKEQEYIKLKSSNPGLRHVRIMDGFLTDQECEYIMELSKSKFQPSKLMAEKNIHGYGRTSFSAELHVFPHDAILNGVRDRAAALVKMPDSHFEYFQCLYYDPGQEYQAHYDTFDESSERGKKVVFEKGQRKYTILAYLNDDFEGGGTFFPNLDLLINPKKGRIVIFNNLDDEGKILPASFHAGLPVTKGRKYAVNIWVRNKPCRD